MRVMSLKFLSENSAFDFIVILYKFAHFGYFDRTCYGYLSEWHNFNFSGMDFRISTMFRTGLIALLLFAGSIVSMAEKSPQQAYVDTYSRTAVAEMYRSGVPASITLAQGMLESSNGRSELAVKGNNHFGIKCHDWTGRKMYYDDDRKGECFRVYASAWESFRDHSDFLRYRDRYKSLFDLDITDYRGWAYGLKRAGYATDPAYPRKLIKLIEDYGLDRFDTMPSSYGAGSEDNGKKSRKARAKEKDDVPAALPESPSELEQALPLDRSEGKKFNFSLSRQLYSQNGVPFVYSVPGETYSDIARANGLFRKEILRFNDLTEESDLLPGTVVYLQKKKKQAAKNIQMHIVDGDESLRDIAQRYGVRMKSLEKMNSFVSGTELREGDVVKLRKR